MLRGNSMMRGFCRYCACPAAVTILVVWSTLVFADTDLPRLWSVSDDTLSVPLGTVVDVAVGEDGVVYLLDSQNMLVRRISAGGVELPPLGGWGEGPGEFTHPILITTNADGGCFVIQDFFGPAVCLMPSGSVCAGPDLSVIRSRFITTMFFCARSDRSGRLLLHAMTAARPPESGSFTDAVRHGNSLFALRPGDVTPMVLFSDRPELCETNTVRLKEHDSAWSDRYWDVDRAGRIIYADPSGAYRIFIGHPADGKSVVLDLPEQDTDTKNLERLAASVGRSQESLSRIAAVHWVGDERFLVKPMACIPGPTTSRAGTFELFDTSGFSYGREELECDYDPDSDQFFLRHGLLVIIKGGQSAIRADISQKAALIGKQIDSPASGETDWENIRVDAYSLVLHYSTR